MAFLLALALVVSVMSGLGLSVSAEQESNTPGTEEVQQQDKTEAGAAPSEVKAEEEAAKPEEKPVLEEKKDEQKAEGEGSGDAVKDTTADSNGNQKDEPQAEPAAEEPAEPEEEPAASYLSTLSVEELYAYLTKLDDNNFAAAWKELTDSQKAEYNAYVLKMTFGNNKTTTSYEGGGAAASMTNVAGLVSNLAASQKALRNSPARAARAAVQAATDVKLSDTAKDPVNGLYMNKWITKNKENTADTGYTIHLESYTTGKTTTTYSSKPCDIVLVLDQSGSMAERFKKVTYTEKKFMDTATNRQAFEYRDNLYVKATVGDVVGKHIPVRVEREFDIGSLSYTYTYTYTLEGKEHTVTIVGRNNKIPSSTNQDQFFADGVEKQLYYAEESTNDEYTRLDGLTDAVKQFVGSVEKDATDNDVDHNIAIVGFASHPGKTYVSGQWVNQNTEILTGVQIQNKDGVAYKGDGYSTATGNALQSAKTQEGKKSIAGAIDALDASGATRTDCGIEMANDIFKAKVASDPSRYEGGKRNKVVVVFTDGEPNNYSGYDETYATKAVKSAKTLKGDNATVYTIGIFDGADANDTSTNANKFMHYVSSNYPQAESMTKPGTAADKLGYYLTAADSAALNEIFSKIASEIGSSDVALNATTQTIDKMSAEFKLPDNIDASKVKVYEVPCTEVNADGSYTFGNKTELTDATVSINKDAGTVSVSGFDYSTKYINKDAPGKVKGYKLLIEFPVEYKNEAWFGGNDIESNDIGSGIYNGGSCYGTFEVPKVNRAIDYKIGAKDQTIYVTNQADLKELLAYPEKDAGRTYQPNGTNNKYVDITYTLKQGDTVIGTYTISHGEETGTWKTDANWTPALEDCTEYTWTCTVTPTTKGDGALGVDGTPDKPAEEMSYGPETGTVHVLYPTAKAEDKTIYWGEEAKAADLVKKDSWKEKTSHGTIPAVSGTEPTVTVTPVFVAGDSTDTPEKDGAYKVTVKVGTKDVTSVVREMKGITNTNPVQHTVWNCDDHADVDNKTHDFCIHVKSKKLTVVKKVTGNMGDTNQEFEFKGTNVHGANADFKLKDNGEQQFKLKVGEEAKITETAAAGYETDISVNPTTAGSTSGRTYTYDVKRESPDAVTVTYTNKKQINPPNGITTTIAPYAIMVVLAAGAGVYFVYSRRRRNR